MDSLVLYLRFLFTQINKRAVLISISIASVRPFRILRGRYVVRYLLSCSIDGNTSKVFLKLNFIIVNGFTVIVILLSNLFHIPLWFFLLFINKRERTAWLRMYYRSLQFFSQIPTGTYLLNQSQFRFPGDTYAGICQSRRFLFLSYGLFSIHTWLYVRVVIATAPIISAGE